MKFKFIALFLVLGLFSASRPAQENPRPALEIEVIGHLPKNEPRAPQQGTEAEKIQLPDMGDSSGTLLSPSQEAELGASFFRGLHAQIPINEDLEIQQYIQSIGHQLAAHSYAPSNPFYFFVVIDPQINAFAGPGGYIGVNSGLILLTEAESELASVIGHEIAHVTQRHLYRSAESANRMTIPTIAATLAAALLTAKSPQMGSAALMAVQAGSVQFQINFTREHEQEADRVGMNTLYESNFDPRSMPTFFERLTQATRYSGSSVPEFLRTHPMSENRVADTRGRAESYPFRQYPDSISYLITKAKLRAMLEPDKKNALLQFQAAAQQGTPVQRAVARYGMGLVYLDTQQFDLANSTFEQLVAAYPTQPQYIAAMARTAVESHNYEKANRIFAAAVNKFPSNDPLKNEYIRSLLKSSQPQVALQVLENLSEQQKTQPFYFELMAQAQADLHHPGESHRYLAEYYYATGQTDEAIQQIRLARNEKNLSYQLLAIISERLNFYLSEQEEHKTQR